MPRHAKPGQHEERAEDVDRVMESVEKGRAGEDEDRTQDDRTDDPPEQDTPLRSGRDAEVAEDESEDEEVVDRERLLDHEPRQVLARRPASLPREDHAGERGPERRPADAPAENAPERD